MRARSVFAGLAAASLCALAGTAHAEPVLGLEPRLELLVPDDPRPGGGLAFTAGYAAELYPLYILPEASFSVGVFPGDQTFAQLRATGGVRAGLTAAVEPSIHVHAGYGIIAAPAPAGGRGLGFDGFALDAGLGLDKRVERGLTLGGHAELPGALRCRQPARPRRGVPRRLLALSAERGPRSLRP
jgi:hypothetical protein